MRRPFAGVACAMAFALAGSVTAALADEVPAGPKVYSISITGVG